MQSNWRLFRTAFWIAIKHSSRRLLCLLCVLTLCGGLLVAVTAAPKEERTREKARIAVVNHDTDPLSGTVLDTLFQAEDLLAPVELCPLEEDALREGAYAAVITIPENFLKSIMTGENRSPTVEIMTGSPLEAAWIRQLALSGVQALSAAQLGVYTVLHEAESRGGMPDSLYQLMAADVNVTLMRAFFERGDRIQARTLSASGTLTLPQYYFAALGAALLFCYGFLFYGAMDALRRFGAAAGHKGALLAAGLAHLFLLQFCFSAPLCCLAAGGLTVAALGSAAVLALLSCAAAQFCIGIFPTGASCAAGCILISLTQAFFGGLLIPLPLMPSVFSAIAPFLPAYQGMQALGGAFQGGLEATAMSALIQAAALLAAGTVCWLRPRRGREGGQ